MSAQPDQPCELDRLLDLLVGGGVVVLSGAGLSTESGIPDYRGPTGLARGATPMTYQVFTRDADARRRYWARSHVGWRQIGAAAPNTGHRAVAGLQALDVLSGVVTQNVDGLHQAGGARDVVELHGSLHRVVCLDCGARTPRQQLDERLREVNAGWQVGSGASRPDGDVELAGAEVERFVVAPCFTCGGVLKPDVVFFGETVPADRVERCFALVARAQALLVIGSSLSVMSGYRFVLRAAKLGLPVAVVNDGPTRGDAHASIRLHDRLGQVLPALLDRLGGHQ